MSPLYYSIILLSIHTIKAAVQLQTLLKPRFCVNRQVKWIWIRITRDTNLKSGILMGAGALLASLIVSLDTLTQNAECDKATNHKTHQQP